MNQFITKYAPHVQFVLSGFDRLVLRGTLRRLAFAEGLATYLSTQRVLLKDFADYVSKLSARIKAASLAGPLAEGAPIQYLDSAADSKEDLARQIARERKIDHGTICVLSCVEPCQTFQVYRNRERKQLELRHQRRKCLHLYHYQIHPVFGFMHARLQTWFPFSIQICLNGREWLAQQLAAEEIAFARWDNCMLQVADSARAQALLTAQLQVNWPTLLNHLAHTLNPLHDELFGAACSGYYWSTYQSEWATDVVLGDPAQLRRIYPRLVQQGITTFASPDVMRFLGRKLQTHDRPSPAFHGEVVSDVKTRAEGVRIKHRVNHNSVKLYDKAYTDEVAVLRAETTINNEEEFRVYRPKEGDPEGERSWRVLRRGIADLHRRAQVSQAANDRYLDALASVDTTMTLAELTARLTEPVTWHGKRVRGLHPFAPADLALLEAVSRGEFTINGLRNRDLQQLLFAPTANLTPQEARRRSAQVTRKLRLLRAHGLLQKVPHTHRYQVTSQGRQIITALLTARQTPISRLLPQAA